MASRLIGWNRSATNNIGTDWVKAHWLMKFADRPAV